MHSWHKILDFNSYVSCFKKIAVQNKAFLLQLMTRIVLVVLLFGKYKNTDKSTVKMS